MLDNAPLRLILTDKFLCRLVAPTRALYDALVRRSLGHLNPFPFAIQTGNTFGWVCYGYCVRDPFVIAANVPGLMISLWLNIGATKIQYMNVLYALTAPTSHPEKERENAMILREFILTPQERILFNLLIGWTFVLVISGFFSPVGDPVMVVGIACNLNMILYYAAPLEKMQQVIRTGDASSIHVPTMILYLFNTSFWVFYSSLHNHIVLLIPSAIGAVLAVIQGFLLIKYRPYRAKREELEPLNNGQDRDRDIESQ